MSEQLTVFPAGLTRRLFSHLTDCANAAGDELPAALLRKAEAHLADVHKAHRHNAMVNIRLAEAICGSLRAMVADWDNLPPTAQPWLRGAIHYFVNCDDDQPDFTSPIGFEDDAEVLNACLRLAGRDDLCLKPEDYDDA